MPTSSSQRCRLSVSIGTAAASTYGSLIVCVPLATQPQESVTAAGGEVSLLSSYIVSRLKGSIRTNGPSGPSSSVSGQPNNVLLQQPNHKKCHSYWWEVSLLSSYIVSRLKGSIRTNGPSGPSSSESGQPNNVTPAAQPQKVSQLLAGRANACHSDYRLFQDYRT